MPKMKTHKTAAKRLRRSGTGKLMRKKAFRSHILEKKSAHRKRRLSKITVLSEHDAGRADRMLGGK